MTGAELSSLTTAIEELTKRVGAMAEQAAADHREEEASELFAVERSLRGAWRRLGRLSSPRRRR